MTRHREYERYENARDERLRAIHKAWKQMAGEHYDTLMAGVDSALAMMKHSDIGVRTAALGVCAEHWRCESDSRYHELCIDIARTDLIDEHRANAIGALGVALRKTNDRSAKRFLARLVEDTSNSISVRNTAYVAIGHIERGLTLESAMLVLTNASDLLEIDWSHIRVLAMD